MDAVIAVLIVAAALLVVWLATQRLRSRPEPEPDAEPKTAAEPAPEPVAATEPVKATPAPPRIPQAPYDLRTLPTVRTRIKGTSHYVRDSQRHNLGARYYFLVREPDNPHDRYAIKVLTPRGRHVGYVAAKRAAGMSPLLDQIGADGYTVDGAAATEHSIALWVDLPSIPELRKHVAASRLV